jgi:DNA-binding MarR family transcriptional regulator
VIDQLELIAVASVALTARALVETAGSELTFLGWRTLVLVGASNEAPRLSELADRLAMSRPSTSKLVRRLVRRELLELADDPGDRRGVRVGLTSTGRQLLQAVVDRRRELLMESLGGSSPDMISFSDAGSLALVAQRLGNWT